MKKLILFLVILFDTVSIFAQAQISYKDYLQTVLGKLNKVESASYTRVDEYCLPGDTVVTSRSYFEMEMKCPSDTTIGSAYISLKGKNNKIINGGYDGKRRVNVFDDKKGIMITDYSITPYPHGKIPFRAIQAPFFNYVESILYYVLHTKDSIDVKFLDEADSYHLKLTINEDKQVEFFGKDYKIDSNSFTFDPTSFYEVWFKKSDNIPYKYNRCQSQESVTVRCEDVTFNKLNANDFILENYFPAGYEVRTYSYKKTVQKPDALLGKPMPDWSLRSSDGKIISSSDLKSKVILLQITGIGCGPCLVSIDYMNKICEKYSSGQLDVVAIESWGRNMRQAQFYKDQHKIKYPLLVGEQDVIEMIRGEKSTSVPFFIIVGPDRKIKYTTNGFGADSNWIEIEKKIDALLK